MRELLTLFLISAPAINFPWSSGLMDNWCWLRPTHVCGATRRDHALAIPSGRYHSGRAYLDLLGSDPAARQTRCKTSSRCGET